ncbi:MAG TPA: GlxA family transcriptional regulator [Gammaproteobacteria bacterium]|nr:GlxA family transcriptional regulator [Gammaproteobacteria bacterium]
MPHRIDVLIFEEFQLLDASGPIAAFEIATGFHPGAYQINAVAVAAGPIRSSSGIALHAAALADGADTLLIAGGEGVRAAARCRRTTAYVQALAQAGARVASVCTGSFVLAAAGLLSGRRATTHWAETARFARLFPDVQLDSDRIFTRDGKVWTSAGVTAGIDLALALIAEDLGERTARDTARQLVLPYRRSGGQSQFSSFLESQRGGRFSAVLDWARDHLAQPLSVEQLAERAAMSPRHFARAFKRETGVTPAKAIERLRLEAARARLEADIDPVDRIADLTGFGDAERMRRAFVRSFGQPPQALRRAARARQR